MSSNTILFTIILTAVPGIAEKLAFKDLKRDEVFFCFNRKNSDLVDLFHDNNVGGPAIIYNRYMEAGSVFYKKKIKKLLAP